MWTFYIEEFYHVLQGVLVFQLLFFYFIFRMTKRVEVKYYCVYLLFALLYYFINGPKTFFNIPDDLIFDSPIYVKINYFLLAASIYFYLVFLITLFEPRHNPLFEKIAKITKISILILLVLFYILPFFNVSRSLIFYTTHLVTLPFAVYTIYHIGFKKSQFYLFIQLGILFNVVGYLISLLMILRYNTGIRLFALDEYPLIWMRVGTLFDIFFFQLAIIWRWYEQEKELTTKDLKSQIEVERLRNQISQEIHDDIGSTLSKINLTSFLASKKLLANEVFDVSTTFLNIQKSSQEMMTNLKEIVWSIDRENKFDSDVFARIEEYATTMCATKDMKTVFSFKHDPTIELNINVKYHLFLISKEVINNAVKYSNAKNFRISTFSDDKNCILTLADDGQGFDPQTVQEGVGLKSIKNRSMKIKSELKIQTELGNGTVISVNIPI